MRQADAPGHRVRSGLLAEEFARASFEVNGINPAPETIETARTHASASGLSIEYQTGTGEHLPFPGESFDQVACCDVLKHVDDVDRVISEIARVLRLGGLLLYETVNRTVMRKLAVINVVPEWSSAAFAEPNSHVWNRRVQDKIIFKELRQ